MFSYPHRTRWVRRVVRLVGDISNLREAHAEFAYQREVTPTVSTAREENGQRMLLVGRSLGSNLQRFSRVEPAGKLVEWWSDTATEIPYVAKSEFAYTNFSAG